MGPVHREHPVADEEISKYRAFVKLRIERDFNISTTARCKLRFLPWEGRSKHFTQEFEVFALTLMREMLVKRAGQILGESDTGNGVRERFSNLTQLCFNPC